MPTAPRDDEIDVIVEADDAKDAGAALTLTPEYQDLRMRAGSGMIQVEDPVWQGGKRYRMFARIMRKR